MTSRTQPAPFEPKSCQRLGIVSCASKSCQRLRWQPKLCQSQQERKQKGSTVMLHNPARDPTYVT
eukprot:6152046-Amphidinium_carterae.1